MKYINTSKGPKTVGHYSQAVITGDFIFCSGQIGKDPKTDQLVEGIENQTLQVLNNIEIVLKAAGSDSQHIVKTTVYVKNIADFSKINDVYASFFGNHKPARATVEVSNLPKGALIEIEAVALV